MDFAFEAHIYLLHYSPFFSPFHQQWYLIAWNILGFIWVKKQTVFWVDLVVISIFNNGLGAAHHQFKIQLLTSLNSTDTTTMKLYVPARTIVKFIYLYSEFMVKTINIPMQVVMQFHFWWVMQWSLTEYNILWAKDGKIVQQIICVEWLHIALWTFLVSNAAI